MTAPRMPALKDDLTRLQAAQVPAAVGGGLAVGSAQGAAAVDLAAAVPEGTEVRWGVGLPADFQRAVGEIYRSMRSEGATSVRDWLNHRYTGSRASPVWADLWTLATSIDYGLRGARSEQEVLQILGTQDVMELSLRRLAAYSYETRTGDKVGAQHMLAAAPPGAETDVAPTWLVQSSTMHSKQEHQRDERVNWSAARQRKGKGKGDKGKDKGRDKGKEKGQAQEAGPAKTS